jgi:enoyl-CoA hydratase/carnithine racemase
LKDVMMLPMSLVLTEDHGPVRHLVLNRPEKRNALNDELILGIREAAAAAAAGRRGGPRRPTATCSAWC